MFAQHISLWDGGPALTLGEYFIWFRYLFCFLFLAWVALVFRFPRSWVVLGGVVVLACVGWLAFDYPLGRAYGLAEQRGALEELAEPMVAAASGTAGRGRIVDERNHWPFWSLLVASSAGFDPGRVLAIHPWLPLASLLLLAAATYAAAHSMRIGGMAPGLAVFFALFLSVPRLGFLDSEGTLWTEALWLRPRIGFGLACTLFAFHFFARVQSLRALVVGGVVLGVAGWTEPRWLLLGGAGVLVWVGLAWPRGDWLFRPSVGLGLAVATYWVWPSALRPSSPPGEIGTWQAAVQSLLSVSLEQGAVFYLAVLGLVFSWRGRSRAQLLLLAWIAGAYVLWIATAVSADAAALLDRTIVKTFLRVLLALSAGWGAHRVLSWIDTRWKLDTLEGAPRFLRRRATYEVGLCSLLILSLPWVFPFWWNPVRMDPLYRASLEPVDRRFSELAAWIRANTTPDAVFVAGPSYAPWVPALSGRRVLVDDEVAGLSRRASREQAQQWIAGSGEPDKIRAAARAWGVSHLAWGRLDARGPIRVDVEFLNQSPIFSLVHQQRRWVSVFAIQTDDLGER